MSPETEDRIVRQLTTFEELVKHLATKEELQKLRVEMILWIIGTNVAVGGILLAVMLWLHTQTLNQLTFLLQHWKP
jgi:hypothetical protein